MEAPGWPGPKVVEPVFSELKKKWQYSLDGSDNSFSPKISYRMCCLL